jgi:hypothetical protein
MKKIGKTLFLIMFAVTPLIAQESKLEKDEKAIRNMCGCYEVSFNFAETFYNSKDSNYVPSHQVQSKAIEWVTEVQEQDNKIILQHLLIVGEEAHQSVIKHWRQDWLYENTDFHMYYADNTWKYISKEKKEVSGQWTQKVFQVDDSPRYEGSGTWVYVDGKAYWENTTNAPLPRREYTERSDYNVTGRNNRHEIISTGWIHDQDNTKIIREEDKPDEIIANEKGYNSYVKIDDSKCLSAQKWWEDNYEFWAEVRVIWDEIYKQNKNLQLHEKVDGKTMFGLLFDMEPTTKPKKIKESITSFTK